VVVRAVRLRLLVPGDARLSLWQAVTINAYGDAASAVTPGRVGGDPARFLACRRAGVEAPRVLAGLAVEALIDWVLLAAATVVLGLVFADTADAGGRGRRRAGVRGRLRGHPERGGPRHPADRVARLHADTARRAGRAALCPRGAGAETTGRGPRDRSGFVQRVESARLKPRLG